MGRRIKISNDLKLFSEVYYFQIPNQHSMARTTTTTQTTFTEVNRKQAFNGLIQEVILEPSKQNLDLESYFDDLVEYLQQQMDEMLRTNGRGIQINWSVQVRYSTPLMKTVDYDDEKNWFRCHDDDDDE